jgi:putative flippase GtrA
MRATATRLALFGAVGLSALAVHYAVVVLLVGHAGMPPIAANVAGWLVAFSVSFFGHFSGTFRHPDLRAQQAVRRFLVVSLLGFAANQGGYALLLHITAIRYDVAVIVVSLAVAAMTYVLSRAWAFRPEAGGGG